MKYYIYRGSVIGGKLIGIVENEKEKETLIDNFCTKRAQEVIDKDMAQDEADFQNKYGDIRQRIENDEETEDNIWRVKEFKIQF